MMNASYGWAVVAVLVGSSPLPAADGFEVELTVQNPTAIDRQREPICGGLPLPKGRFFEGQEFVLSRSDGTEIPCQACPLVVETDGTLRWVLLDFQDTLPANAETRYMLKPARSPSAAPPGLNVQQNESGIVVDTGAVRFTVATNKPFSLLDRVEADGKLVVTGGEVSYVQMQGRSGWDDKSAWQHKRLLAGPPKHIELHHAGPLRTTIKLRGSFQDDPLGAGYQAWITAWAGSSRVVVKYKLCNSNSKQYTLIPVARSTVELNLARSGDVLLGASKPLPAGAQGWMHQGLQLRATYQDIPGAVQAGSDDRVLWTGNGPQDRPAGWIASLGESGLFVLDRLFATNPARRLSAGKGKLALEGIAERFRGPKDQKFQQDRRVGEPWQAEGFWLYDCSHHTSEYVFDFAPPRQPDALDALAASAQHRLLALASPDYYSRCGVFGAGQFGTLADEIASYRKWGWTFSEGQLPIAPQPLPGAFVAWEDNHYESEADSVEGLLRMFVRTRARGWFDLAEAWARYHMDLQAWRTDGWKWKDGAIWFPQGGPQGNVKTRDDWNFTWGPDYGQRKGDPDCHDIWRHARAKSCYCHFYGAGLADYFCLTGDPDALTAAIDDVEQKDEEFRRGRKFVPGETPVGSIRGFGRGFEVAMRVLRVDPQNPLVRDLCRLCARTLWQSPLLDERGFHCSHVGGGFSGMKTGLLSPPIRKWMQAHGIRYTTKGDTVDTLSKGDRSWPVRCMGGTWQHIYVQNGAHLYARYFNDDNMRDFTIAFAQLSAKYMLSDKCHQTWYYTYFDVPDLGMVFDPWRFEHTGTSDGVGCVHSGWYTRFYPDACTRGFSLVGEPHLLERAREFWYYGSKRGYRTKHLRGGPNEVGQFASHRPPKDDTVLSTGRLFYETSHPKADRQPPTAVNDLAVRLLGNGKAEVSFTAPVDAGGGSLARYQVKVAEMPIAPYDEWDFASDHGRRRNWWKAVNCEGEPAPAKAGSKERFVVTGVPDAESLHFAIRSFDDSGNRSAMSAVVRTRADPRE